MPRWVFAQTLSLPCRLLVNVARSGRSHWTMTGAGRASLCRTPSVLGHNIGSPLRRTQPMPLVEPGKNAPAFSLKDQDAKTHRLADYAGRPLILYFYPKDDTPGCTTEPCAFPDILPKFKSSKAPVLGASDPEEASNA